MPSLYRLNSQEAEIISPDGAVRRCSAAAGLRVVMDICVGTTCKRRSQDQSWSTLKSVAWALDNPGLMIMSSKIQTCVVDNRREGSCTDERFVHVCVTWRTVLTADMRVQIAAARSEGR